MMQAAGFEKQAQDHFARAFSITPGLVARLMQSLEAAGIEYIIAPYESDAQLAYLSAIGYVAVVVSEDSDLLVFGCERVVFKLDYKLQGELVTLEDVFSRGPLKGWTMERLRWFAIVCGCDYLPNLPSVGPKAAYSLVSHSGSLDEVLRKLSLCKKFGGLSCEYIERVLMTLLCYSHQVVYCPVNRCNTYLRPLESVPEELSDDAVADAVGR